MDKIKDTIKNDIKKAQLAQFKQFRYKDYVVIYKKHKIYNYYFGQFSITNRAYPLWKKYPLALTTIYPAIYFTKSDACLYVSTDTFELAPKQIVDIIKPITIDIGCDNIDLDIIIDQIKSLQTLKLVKAIVQSLKKNMASLIRRTDIILQKNKEKVIFLIIKNILELKYSKYVKLQFDYHDNGNFDLTVFDIKNLDINQLAKDINESIKNYLLRKRLGGLLK